LHIVIQNKFFIFFFINLSVQQFYRFKKK